MPECWRLLTTHSMTVADTMLTSFPYPCAHLCSAVSRAIDMLPPPQRDTLRDATGNIASMAQLEDVSAALQLAVLTLQSTGNIASLGLSDADRKVSGGCTLHSGCVMGSACDGCLFASVPAESQHLESYGPRRRMPYSIYLSAGLGAVKDAIGLNSRELADNLLRNVRLHDAPAVT